MKWKNDIQEVRELKKQDYRRLQKAKRHYWLICFLCFVIIDFVFLFLLWLVDLAVGLHPILKLCFFAAFFFISRALTSYIMAAFTMNESIKN